MTKATARLIAVCGLVLLLSGVAVLFTQQSLGWFMVIPGGLMFLAGAAMFLIALRHYRTPRQGQ